MYKINDTPVISSDEDKFGFNKLASQIATAIVKNTTIEGTVIAVNGKWGSGKSSLINLIKKKIEELVSIKTDNSFIISRFNCWWIRGEEALISEFFRQIYSTIEVDSGDEKRVLIADIGSNFLLSTASILGNISNLIVPGCKEIITELTNTIGNSLKQTQNIDETYSKLCELLRNSNERYLMIIDDIDRMLKDEVLLMFKLIKTVGHLPNFTYLLAYDRKHAENALNGTFSALDDNFLEKFVQAGFNVPYILKSDIRDELVRNFKMLCNDQTYLERKHFKFRLDNLILPCVRTPRNLKRLINMISITWRTVEGQLDFADFVTIETFRILQPSLYDAIHQNKDKFLFNSFTGETEDSSVYYLTDALRNWHSQVNFTEIEDEAFKNGLINLFSTEAQNLVSKVTDSVDLLISNSDKRLISNQTYFDKYFQYTSSGDLIKYHENVLFENSNDKEYIVNRLNGIIESSKIDNNSQKLSQFLIEYIEICEELGDGRNDKILSCILPMYKDLRDVFALDNPRELEEPYLLITQLMPIFFLAELGIPVQSEKEDSFSYKIYSIIGLAGEKNLEFIFDFAQVIYQLKNMENPKISIGGNLTFQGESPKKLFELATNGIKRLVKKNNLIESGNLRRKLLFWDKLAGNQGFDQAKKFIESNINKYDFVVAFLRSFFYFGRKLNYRLAVNRYKNEICNLADTQKLHDSISEIIKIFGEDDKNFPVLNLYQKVFNDVNSQ